LYDNDEAGREATEKITNTYPEIEPFFVPEKKDIAEYREYSGKNLTNNLLKSWMNITFPQKKNCI
jgi:DNA primase